MASIGNEHAQGGGSITYQERMVQSIKHADGTTMGRILRASNSVIALLLIATGLHALFNGSSASSTIIISSVYVIFFAFVLFAFELRFQSIQLTLAKYFGFLYNTWGRVGFFIFVGTLSLGLSDMGIAVGVLCYVVLLFNIYVLSINKNIKAHNALYEPYQGDSGDQEDEKKQFASAAVDYLSKNPEVARSALAYASEHPDQVQSASKAFLA